ncbi:hypothetical protein FRC17_004054 [Serendipita sp. 399]|nr:hypothetical protein FRC17_004054 [Serendipita sp. 399]
MLPAVYGPPPPYHAPYSPVNLSMLSIDGGGTRPICALHILCEIMYRLSWDLGHVNSRRYKAKQDLYPADYFDYIGGGGTGALVAFLLACGSTAEEARETFIRLTPRIKRAKSIKDIELVLQSTIYGSQHIWYHDEYVIDVPSRTNVWIPSRSHRNMTSKGVLIEKGTPVSAYLLPLVAAEVYREWIGRAETSQYTLPFLQDICPNIQTCSLLFSLGSTSAPSHPSPIMSTSTQTKTQYSIFPQWIAPYFSTSCSPTSWMPASTSQQSEPIARLGRAVHHHQQNSEIKALEGNIPPSAWGRNVIRLEPNLTIWNALGDRRWPDEWEDKNFGEHKMLTKNYCAKPENEKHIDTVIAILRTRPRPGYPN